MKPQRSATTVTHIPPFLSPPRSSATSAAFSPRFARSTVSSVIRAEEVAAEVANREREAILRLEADAVVAAELKKELNGWIAKAVEDDIEEEEEVVEEKEKNLMMTMMNTTKQEGVKVRFAANESMDTRARKEEENREKNKAQSSIIHEMTQTEEDIESLRFSLQRALDRANAAESAQFKAEMGERVALRKAAAHASAAAALRKVVAAIETSNSRQTKKLVSRLETAGHQLSKNRTEIESLKEELSQWKQQKQQQRQDFSHLAQSKSMNSAE